MQVRAFQNYRLLVQQMKYYSLIVIKDYLAEQLFPNKPSILEKYEKEIAERRIILASDYKELKRIINRKTFINKEKMRHYLNVWKNKMMKKSVLEIKNSLKVILNEVIEIENNTMLNKQNVHHLKEHFNSIFHSFDL